MTASLAVASLLSLTESVLPATPKPGPTDPNIPGGVSKGGGGAPVVMDKPNTADQLGPLTVADVLTSLRLAEADLHFSDEPRGKLRALWCVTTLRDTKVKVCVTIRVVYTTDLMSATGK